MTPADRSPGGEGPGGDEPDTFPAEMGRYAGHGLTLGLSTALFAWLGDWLDGRLGTAPVFVVTGAFLGFAGALYSMYRDLVHRREPDDAGPEEER